MADRYLLKLSGEALSGAKGGMGFDEASVRAVAVQVKEACDNGAQIGMLATVMNCLYVSEVFRTEGMKTEVFTAFPCGDIGVVYSKDAVMRAFDEGKVVFFAGGTGHPYFSTDTTTVLRAVEIEADRILLAKSIDGVYDSDPATDPEAKKFDRISIDEVYERRLKVVDLPATALCLENRMPMTVFSMNEEGSILAAIKGSINGTEVTV